MGAFLSNVHIRCDSAQQVTEVMQQMDLRGAWISGPNGNWVTVWDSISMTRAAEVAQHLSAQLEAPAIAFMVHDSDVLFYWLFDNGTEIDQYNSCPEYFGEEVESIETYEADCETLQRYCRPGTTKAQLEEILKILTNDDLVAGIPPSFVFAEQRLGELAKYLGIPETVAMTDYGDIGRDVQPEEVSATWIGKGEPADYPHSFGMETDFGMEGLSEEDEEGENPLAFPSGEMHMAAMNGDITTIEDLVAGGSDINVTNQIYVVTPLALAAASAGPDVLRKMVELGADVHCKGSEQEGSTAIRMAVQANKLENVKALAQLGADLHEYDSKSGSLLHVAIRHAAKEMFAYLLEQGVDPNQKSPEGIAPREMIRSTSERLKDAEKMLGGAVPPNLALSNMQNDLKEMETILDRYEKG